MLVSGRPDWLAHVHYFAMFGALGWSFGGSMSYMGVVGYTHSGHPPSVLYGFANLFVIGFLWAFMGGAGTALPVFLTGDRLALFFVPLAAIFSGWAIQSVLVDLLFSGKGASGRASLSWYDTDWLATLVAMAAGVDRRSRSRRLRYRHGPRASPCSGVVRILFCCSSSASSSG